VPPRDYMVYNIITSYTDLYKMQTLIQIIIIAISYQKS